MALLASILIVSYALFFYMQLSEERRIKASLFEQQTEVQSRSLESLSQRILADLRLLEATVQGLSESAYMQSGDLAGEKAQKLLSEKYAYLRTISKADRIFVIDAGGRVVWASAEAEPQTSSACRRHQSGCSRSETQARRSFPTVTWGWMGITTWQLQSRW